MYIYGLFSICWAKSHRKKQEILSISFYFWSTHCCLIVCAGSTPGKRRRHKTVFWRKLGFFPRHMAWFHYNSLLQIINSIFKHILRPFGSCWVLARWDNKFIKGLAGTAVPSASSPVKPLFLSSADAFAFIFCCLPWCQMASLPLLYCFSPNNYLANYSALLTSASGTWAPKLQSWSPTRRKW